MVMCGVQEWQLSLSYFESYFPLTVLDAISCPLHNLNTLWYIIMRGPWLQMYTVQGNSTPLRWQTTERSPSRAWQTGGGSFLLLPRRHALSSRWLWAFNHNTCENRLEEVQGAEISSLFPPPFFQDTWPCVQHVCAERNAPCQWNLASNKALPPASAAKWQSNDQTDLQC